MTPSVEEQTEDYYHVRFDDPDEFDTIRTPDWAENAASSVAEGAEARTGHQKGRDDSDWETQSVLVPTDSAANEDEAIERAEEVVEKINE
jgi:hypothetical protein